MISHVIAQKTLNYKVLLEEEKSCLQSFMVIIKPLETVLTSQLTIRGGKAGLSHHLTFSFSHQLLSTTLTLTPEHIFLFSWKWQPTPVFLPGKSHGQKSLRGYSPWGHKRVRHDWATKQQHGPADTVIWNSSLQNWEKMNLSCSKSPSVQYLCYSSHRKLTQGVKSNLLGNSHSIIPAVAQRPQQPTHCHSYQCPTSLSAHVPEF